MLTKETIKAELKNEINTFFNNQAKIEEDASLIKLGLESLQVMKILSRWMKAGYDISFSDMMSNPTIDCWSEIIFESQRKTKKK